jgi:TetR/AcrR family transcriptional repressor of nem operon
MARPKEFDRETALKAAQRVFWAHGYEAASTEELLRAMGISRQSMYDTFGDKRRLYLEALQRYNADSLSNLLDGLRAAASPLKALEKALLTVASPPPEVRVLGCMGINAICEFGQSDPEVATLSQASGATLLSMFERVLREAKAKGELPAAADERAAAEFLSATLTGMKVSAKGGASIETLRNIARFAIRSLRAA